MTARSTSSPRSARPTPSGRASQHARLITADANRLLACIINRGRTDVPFDSVDVRKALNLAVDRDRLIEQGLLGYANPMPAMTPSWCSGFPAGATPYPHDPAEARRLFEKGGLAHWAGDPDRHPAPFAGIAQFIASDLRRALDVAVEVTVMPDDQALSGVRALVEKKLELPWDLLVHAWFDLSSEAPPAAVHREFFGKDGAFRAGPLDAGFDTLFARMAVELDGAELVRIAERDRQALLRPGPRAVPVCAAGALRGEQPRELRALPDDLRDRGDHRR